MFFCYKIFAPFYIEWFPVNPAIFYLFSNCNLCIMPSIIFVKSPTWAFALKETSRKIKILLFTFQFHFKLMLYIQVCILTNIEYHFMNKAAAERETVRVAFAYRILAVVANAQAFAG